MTLKERIVSIRIIDKVNNNIAYSNSIGLSVDNKKIKENLQSESTKKKKII